MTDSQICRPSVRVELHCVLNFSASIGGKYYNFNYKKGLADPPVAGRCLEHTLAHIVGV